MWWLVVGLGIAVIGLAGRWWLLRPIRYRHRSLDEVAPFIDTLRHSGFGSVLVIQHEGTEKFMQLAQRSSVVGSEHLLYGFPDAPWSRTFFDLVIQRLEQEGGPVRVRQTDDGPVSRFAEVDLWGDRKAVVDGAVRLLEVTAEVLGVGPDSRFTMWVSGAPDHARWVWDNRAHLEQERRRGGVRAWVAEKSLRSLAGRAVRGQSSTQEIDNDT